MDVPEAGSFCFLFPFLQISACLAECEVERSLTYSSKRLHDLCGAFNDPIETSRAHLNPSSIVTVGGVLLTSECGPSLLRPFPSVCNHNHEPIDVVTD